MALTDLSYRKPVTCRPGTPAHQVARLMSEHEIGAVIVVDDGDRPVGIVTDRDLAVRLVGTERAPDTPVEDVMSAEPVTVSSDGGGIDAAHQMAARGCRRLPVIDTSTGRLVGVVTLDDLLLGTAETVDRVIRVLSQEQTRDTAVIDILSRRQVA